MFELMSGVWNLCQLKRGKCLWKKGLDLIGEPMCHEKQDHIREGVCHFAIL